MGYMTVDSLSSLLSPLYEQEKEVVCPLKKFLKRLGFMIIKAYL